MSIGSLQPLCPALLKPLMMAEDLGNVRLSSNDPHCEYDFDFDGGKRLGAYFAKLFVQSGLIKRTQLMAKRNGIARKPAFSF